MEGLVECDRGVEGWEYYGELEGGNRGGCFGGGVWEAELGGWGRSGGGSGGGGWTDGPRGARLGGKVGVAEGLDATYWHWKVRKAKVGIWRGGCWTKGWRVSGG